MILLEIEKLKKHKQILITYMQAKMDIEDWHGVADSACDLREIEAQLKVFETCQKEMDELVDAKVSMSCKDHASEKSPSEP